MNNSLAVILKFSTGVFLFVTFLSCNKISNDLKPYSNESEFSTTISNNGNTIALVTIHQKMFIGEDSLIVTIKNPNNSIIDSMDVIIYFNEQNDFDHALNYVSILNIRSLAPFKDTSITIYSHPELPFEENQYSIKLLHLSGIVNNTLANYYPYGQAKYFYANDTVPSLISGVKGIITADGTCNLWMKINSTYKSVSGQFQDTLSFNGYYNNGTIENSILLDTLSSNPTKFRFNLFDAQPSQESNVHFTLY